MLFLIFLIFCFGVDLESDLLFKTVRDVVDASKYLQRGARRDLLQTTRSMLGDFSLVVKKNEPLKLQARQCIANQGDCGANPTNCCAGNICALVSLFPFAFQCVDCVQCQSTFSSFDCPDPNSAACQTSVETQRPTRPFPSITPSLPPQPSCLSYQTECSATENPFGAECCSGLTCYNDIIDNSRFGQRCLPCDECIPVINGPEVGTDGCPEVCGAAIVQFKTTILGAAEARANWDTVQNALKSSMASAYKTDITLITITLPPELRRKLQNADEVIADVEIGPFATIEEADEVAALVESTSVEEVNNSFTNQLDNTAADNVSLIAVDDVSSDDAADTENPTPSFPTFAPSPVDPTQAPSSEQPTLFPSQSPSTEDPSLAPSSEDPSISPSSEEPSISPTAEEPSISPTSEIPTVSPSAFPSKAPVLGTIPPTSAQPTGSPSTSIPSVSPETSEPTSNPSTDQPSSHPTTDQPSIPPTTDQPSINPTTEEPTEFPSPVSPSMHPSTSPSENPSSDQPSGFPSQSPSSEDPSISPTSEEPTEFPSAAPSTEEPSISPTTEEPSISPSSEVPTVIPTQSPSFTSPSQTPTTPFPSKAPITPPSISPTTPRPTPTLSQAPTLICNPGNFTEIGSDAIQLDPKDSGLVEDTLTLVLKWPNWMTVESVEFVGSTPSLSFFPGVPTDVWTVSDQNECQGRLEATLDWNDAYHNNILDFDVKADDSGSYLTNTLRFKLTQDIEARGKAYVREYEFLIMWMIQLPTRVEVEFDIIDMYASEYYAQAESLCLKIQTNAQVSFTLEHSNVVTQQEWDSIRDTWIQLVDEHVANTYKLGTVTFGNWITSGGTEIDQNIEDFLEKSDYVFEAQFLQYQPGSVASTKQALELSVDMMDEFNEDERTVILVTYQPPVTVSDPTTSRDDEEIFDVCDLAGAFQAKDVSLLVLALTDRVVGGWSDEALEATFGCLDATIRPQANMEELLNTLSDPSIISSYECITDGELCRTSSWGRVGADMAVETTYLGDNGQLTWRAPDGEGNVFWDVDLGWVIDGYGNRVISNTPGPTPTVLITEVESWFIVPCSTNVPEEWPYFRVGVVGYSVCKVGDQAGFEDPESVISTVGNVPSAYYSQIGTVTATAVEDARLGCSATTVTYDDGAAFNYCYNEIRCSDWVNRCENDCAACVAYDSSGGSQNLVSEFYWTPLPTDLLGDCSFGASTGTCGTEVGPITSTVWYQCVGPTRSIRRRSLAKQSISKISEGSIPSRRILSGACHGLWGPWTRCSKSCGKGFESRVFNHFSGVCAYEDGALEARQCEITSCPSLHDLKTHDAHFIPDVNSRTSKMYLHFTTYINTPWQFHSSDMFISDHHGAVDANSIQVTEGSGSESCDGSKSLCVQEWLLNYITAGVCDRDGMHKLSMIPRQKQEGDSDISDVVAENSIQVILSLMSEGCGQIVQTDRNMGSIAFPEQDLLSGGQNSDSHTMTVTMPVRRPKHPVDVSNQITELLSLISGSIDGAEVLEISRLFKTPVEIAIEKIQDQDTMFDFFDYLPESIGHILNLPAETVRGIVIGSSEFVSFTLHISSLDIASEIYSLLKDSPGTFTRALTLDLQAQYFWLQKEVEFSELGDMTVSVTVQAEASGDVSSHNFRNLEDLGYDVVIHRGFGTTISKESQQQSQTIQIQRTESSSTSETLQWQILFAIICALLALILLALCYKCIQDKRKQKALKATKLYEYHMKKQAECVDKQVEKTLAY